MRQNRIMLSVREKFSEALRAAQDVGKAVSIYHAADGDGTQFEVGFVVAVTGHDLTLNCLNARGELDGTIVLRLEDLDVVETDDPYTQKVALLNEYLGSVFKVGDKATRGESFEGQLERARDERLILSVEDNRGHRFTGFVGECADEYFEIDLISPYGEPEGKAIVQKTGIVKVEVDRRDEQARAFLHRYHFELKKLLEP